MLNRELEQLCQKKHVVEVYNFRITLPSTDQRKPVEVRVVAMDDGTLKIVRVKKNEKRAAAIDVLCLHRCVVSVPRCVCVCPGAGVCACVQRYPVCYGNVL